MNKTSAREQTSECTSPGVFPLPPVSSSLISALLCTANGRHHDSHAKDKAPGAA